MNNLGRSVYYDTSSPGQSCRFPGGLLQGEYMLICPGDPGEAGRPLPRSAVEEAIPFFTDYAAASIMGGHPGRLRAFGVVFDIYSARRICTKTTRWRSSSRPEAKGVIYEAEEALWVKSTQFGDEKDRVVVRDNNTRPTLRRTLLPSEQVHPGIRPRHRVWGRSSRLHPPGVRQLEAFGRGREGLKISWSSW